MRASMYDELIQFRAPEGFMQAISDAAKHEAQTASEWLRRAAIDRLKQNAASVSYGRQMMNTLNGDTNDR